MLLGLAGCFNPDYGDSGFRCETGKCPAGYTCLGPQGARLCVRDGVKPRIDSVAPSPDQASRDDRSLVEDRRQSDLPTKRDRHPPDLLAPKLDGCPAKCVCSTQATSNGCGGTCPICPTCCTGNTCCPTGHVCTGAGVCCKPATCSGAPFCGLGSDGCGGKIDCPCPTGMVCQSMKCVTPCSSAGGPCKASSDCCPTGLICGVAVGTCCYPSGSSCPSSDGGSCCTGFCQNAFCF